MERLQLATGVVVAGSAVQPQPPPPPTTTMTIESNSSNGGGSGAGGFNSSGGGLIEFLGGRVRVVSDSEHPMMDNEDDDMLSHHRSLPI